MKIFKKITIRKNSDFLIHDFMCYCQDSSYNLVKWDLHSNAQLFKIDTTLINLMHVVFLFNKWLIVRGSGIPDSILIENDSGNVLDLLNDQTITGVCKIENSDEYLGIYGQESSNIVFSLFQYSSKGVIWKKNINPSFIISNNKILVSRHIDLRNKRTFIQGHDCNSGNELWIVPVSKYGDQSLATEAFRFKQIFLVDENHFCVRIYENCILLININSGEIIWEIPDFIKMMPGIQYSVKGILMYSKEESKIIGFFGGYEFEIDLKPSLEKERNKNNSMWQKTKSMINSIAQRPILGNEMPSVVVKNNYWAGVQPEERLYTMNTILKGDYIYFTAYSGKRAHPMNVNVVGIYSRKISKVEWFDTLKERKASSFMKLSVGNPYFGVSDDIGNLYIYHHQTDET